MRISFLSILLSLLFACTNYWGNPHKKPVAARLVPVSNAQLLVEPENYMLGRSDTLTLVCQYPGLSGFDVALVNERKVRLLAVERAEDPNSLRLLIQLKKEAPPQKFALVFSKGEYRLTYEYQLLNLKKN